MTKYLISSLIVFLCGLMPAMAQTISLTEAGTLSSKVGADAKNVTLSGKINALDLEYLGELKSLETLDMKGAEIEACEGKLIGGVTRHPANTIPANVFAGSNLKSVTLPSVQGFVIKAGVFSGSKLISIDIPAGVVSVGDGAFAGCVDLKTVVCGAAEIGKGIFSRCISLQEVTFSKATAVPADAFYGDAALTTVKGDISAVDNRAFSGCKALKSFPFSKVKTIGREAFMQSGLEKVDLSGASVDEVGEWAFAMMPNLAELKFGNVQDLGQAVAFACPKLKRIEFSATNIPDFALSQSSGVDVEGLIPDNLEYIGRYALSGLSGIKEITLPESMEKLDDHAMENMTGLETIYVNTTVVPEVGEEVWKGVNQSNVTLVAMDVPSAEEFRNADQWQEFNITDRDTLGNDDIVEDVTLPGLRARFDGDDLIVQANGVEIDRLMLYNPAGQLLISVDPMEDTVVVNTAGFDTRLFIVHATLADGRTAGLKLKK